MSNKRSLVSFDLWPVSGTSGRKIANAAPVSSGFRGKSFAPFVLAVPD